MFRYGLDIRTGSRITYDASGKKIIKFPLTGVDMLIHNANGTVSRVPLDVKIGWNAKKQKIEVNGKILKSTKVQEIGGRLHFDYKQKELNKLVNVQIKALLYKLNNDHESKTLKVLKSTLLRIDKHLKRLKKNMAVIKRNRKAKKAYDALKKTYYKMLVKQKKQMNAYSSEIRKQKRRIKYWKRIKKRFTVGFRGKLKKLEIQFKKLKKQFYKVKKLLNKVLYRHWYKYIKRKPC
jgi:hypothetical protein